jgi:hypothetical protein
VTQQRLIDKPAARVAALSLVLFAINVYVCRELFTIEYLRQMGSIESVFITLARYARDNWSDLSWFPLWYNGIPYQNSYPPLMHLVVAAVSAAMRWSPALAYHATAGFVYCAGPVTLFWLCCRLSRRMSASFFAGVIFSFVSPAAMLIGDVRSDLGSVMRPRRLQTLIVYGEDPHLMGLTLLAISIMLLDYACEKRRPWAYTLAAVSFAATAVTNWLAGAALAIGVAAYVLSSDRVAQVRRRVIAALLIGVIAYALAAPLIPPSTIRTIQFNARTIEGDYTQYANGMILRFAMLGAVIAVAKWALTKAGASRTLQFATYFTLVTGAITLSWAYAKIVFVPQPHRYHLEMEWSIAILAAFALEPLVLRLPKRAGIAVVCAAALAAIPFIQSSRRYARLILEPTDITRHVEFRLARWLKTHMPDARVMVPGSTSFFLNAFTDTPQLGGGFDQGTTNFMIRVATYVLYWTSGDTNRDAEASLAWLKTFGVQAIAVGGPESGEQYKPYQNPTKFNGKLEELWREGDDVLYRVPQRSNSLAHVMTRSQLPVRTPYNGVDIDPLRPYIQALDDPQFPPATMRWTSRHSAVIDAALQPEQIVSVQITHHAGWRAAVNGREAPISADAVGQTVIEPRCSGPCSIELSYDGGGEMIAARALRWTAIAACLIWIIAGLYFDVRKRVAPIGH